MPEIVEFLEMPEIAEIVEILEILCARFVHVLESQHGVILSQRINTRFLKVF